MNDSHFVKIEFCEKDADIKVRANKYQIANGLACLVENCVNNDWLPDLKNDKIPTGVKIGAAIAAGIDGTTLSLCSMKKVYSDIIDVLADQLIKINKMTMKGEN